MNGAIQVSHEEWTRLVQQVALAKASADAAKDAADNARQAAEKADAAINGKVWDHEARLRSLEQGHTRIMTVGGLVTLVLSIAVAVLGWLGRGGAG